ncbi:NAD(P)/FAD-dependent oxidoreductase [Arenimonas sp.]|uniref:NAD(P)/FAD-dependent oxidoreductase n=1 Tax=Arenimonas sp. TaxID=1872635 RepID=UPI0039E42F22
MRIAVIGSGIAGLGSAWLLSRQHDVVLFEKDGRLGGHTHTHKFARDGREYSVDSGFIVHNPTNYPLLTRLFDELGVASQDTAMGFAVQDERNGLEYNASSLAGLFCQPGNLFSPRFLRMVREILRFYRECPALLEETGDGPTLSEYLERNAYSPMFVEDHLVPMASALWSSPAQSILAFPAKYLVRFMANHRMLDAGERPPWRVVRGGSSSYVDAMRRSWPVEVRLSQGVRRVRREADGIVVCTMQGEERFDQVVLACHSDQALAMLEQPTAAEREILGAIPYQENETVLHTDARLLPTRRRAWAAWNAHVPADPGAACTVSYCMNLLQSFDSPEPFVVTLNRTNDIAVDKILARMRYQHPVYTHASVAAQARRAEINGVDRLWYAGAYWGFGFHEDGFRSAVDVARGLGVSW